MKFAWKALVGLGVLLVLTAFSMDTTVRTGYGRVHNIGLQGQQQMLLILGCVLFLAGIVLLAVQKLKQSAEEDLADKAASQQAKQRIEALKTETGAVTAAVVGKVDKLAAGFRIGEDRLGMRFCVGFGIGVFWWFMAQPLLGSEASFVALFIALPLALWPRPASVVLHRLVLANAAIATAYLCWLCVRIKPWDSIAEALSDDKFYVAMAIFIVLPWVAAGAAYWLSRRANSAHSKSQPAEGDGAPQRP